MEPPTEGGGQEKPTKVLKIYPPGPVHKDRKTMLCKFQAKPPNYNNTVLMHQKQLLDEPPPLPQPKPGFKKDIIHQSTLRKTQKQPGYEWVMDVGSGKDATTYKGVKEGGMSDALHQYFVLVPREDGFTAFPANHWYSFKPEYKVKKPASAPVAAGARPPAIMSKTQRQLMEQGLLDDSEEKLPASRILQLKLKDDLDAPATRGGKASRKRDAGYGGGDDAAAEENPQEDLYAYLDDQLRPERPDKAEDWEFEDVRDDDDQDMGHEDEVLEDDPGMRKKLGIEPDTDEEEEGEEDTKDLKKLIKQEESEEEGEGEEAVKEEEGDVEDLDALADTELAAPKAKAPSPPAAHKRATPPPDRVPPAAEAAAASLEVTATKRKAEDVPEQVPTKRARAPTPPASVKQEPSSGPPLTADDLREALSDGPLSAGDLKKKLDQQMARRGGTVNLTTLKTLIAKNCTMVSDGSKRLVMKQGK